MDSNYVTAKYRLGHCCDIYYQENVGGNKALVRRCKKHGFQAFPMEIGLNIETNTVKQL